MANPITEDRVLLLIKQEVEPLYVRLNQLDSQLAYVKGKFEGFGGNLTARQKTIVSGLSIATIVELAVLIFTNTGGS